MKTRDFEEKRQPFQCRREFGLVFSIIQTIKCQATFYNSPKCLLTNIVRVMISFLGT